MSTFKVTVEAEVSNVTLGTEDKKSAVADSVRNALTNQFGQYARVTDVKATRTTDTR